METTLAAAPLSPDELFQKSVSKGYVTEDGQVTPLGFKAVEWKNAGLLDEAYDPTPKGRAYAMTPREALDDPEAFRIRKQEGWDDPEGSVLSRVGDGFVQTAKSLGSFAGAVLESKLDWLDPLDRDRAERGVVRYGEAYRSAAIASNFWVSGATDLALKPFRSEEEEIEAERRRKLTEAELYEDRIGLAVDGLLGPLGEALNIKQALDNAEAGLTEEERAKAAEQGQALGEFANPGDVLLDLATAKVASTLAKPMRGMLGVSERKVAAAWEKQALVKAASTERGLVARKLELATNQLQRAANTGDAALAGKMERIVVESQGRLAKLDELITSSTDSFNRLTRDNAVQAGLKRIVATKNAIKAGALTVPGSALEGVGRFLQAADAKLKGRAVAAFGEDAGTLLPAAKGAAVAMGVGGVAAPLGAAAALLSSGRMIESIGRFSRIMGEETLKARGTLSYWQRVANASGSMPHVAHLLDLPARFAEKSVRVGRGAAGGAAFNAAIQGTVGGGEGIPEAFGSGLVFGAIGAMHGAFGEGRKRDFDAMRAGDMANLRETFDAPQKAMFDSMPRAAKEALGTYAGIFPSLNVRMLDEGQSHYDPVTNTIAINSKSRNPLGPLVAHEVAHYVTEMGLADSVVNRLVGAPEHGVPGMFRAADGTLDPHFQQFLEGYNKRLRQANLAPIDIERAALEYFAEIGSEYLQRGLESGRLQKAARRTAVSRLFGSMLDEMVGSAPIAHRFARHTGTLFTADGRPLKGTGLVRDGVRIDPMSVRMLDKLIGEQAGRLSIEQPGAGKDRAARITPDEYVGNKALTDQLESTFRTDEAGNVLYDKDGKPELLTKAEQEERAAAGAEILKAMRERMNDPDFMLPEGHVEFGPDGGAWGTFFLPEFIQALAEKGILNGKQLAALKSINAMLKRGIGERISTIYQKAIMTSTRTGKKRYKPFAAEFREIAPYMIEVTKDGNIVIRALDVRKLAENVHKRAKTAAGRRLYNGDVGKIHSDIGIYLENHRQGKLNADDPRIGKEKRDFLNTVFGMMRKDQADTNPAFAKLPNPERDAVVRSFRLDRMNSTMFSGNKSPLPYTHQAMVLNLLPEPAAQRLNPFFLPEPVWHASPHKVDRFSVEKIGTGEGAQAFGWGLYFGNEAVSGKGGTYDAQFSNALRYDGKTINWTEDARTDPFVTAVELVDSYRGDPDAKRNAAMDAEGYENAAAIKRHIRQIDPAKIERGSNIYKVELKPDVDEFLDWDKPLSEQSEKVRGAIRDEMESMKAREKERWDYANTPKPGWGELSSVKHEIGDFVFNPSGNSVYKYIAGSVEGRGDRGASKRLAAKGIKGIRYLDGSSRGVRVLSPNESTSGQWVVGKWPGGGPEQRYFPATPEGEIAARKYESELTSYNYVIFDDADIRILEENGKPVTGQERADALEAMHDQQQ